MTTEPRHAAVCWCPKCLPASLASAHRAVISAEVADEMNRQDGKWGQQNHPNGTGGAAFEQMAEAAKARTDFAASHGALTFLLILDEEVAEAFAESDPVKLRGELVQVAAVAEQWIAAIDRRMP